MSTKPTKLRGLRGPLVRGDKDFEVLEGADYITNRIETHVGIHANPWDGTGELEWDQSVGTMVETFRHRNIVRDRLTMLTIHLTDQLRRTPDIVITRVKFSQLKEKRNAVQIGISWAWPRLALAGSAEVQVP